MSWYVPPEPSPCVVVDEHETGLVAAIFGPFPGYQAAVAWIEREQSGERSTWALIVRELRNPADGLHQ